MNAISKTTNPANPNPMIAASMMLFELGKEATLAKGEYLDQVMNMADALLEAIEAHTIGRISEQSLTISTLTDLTREAQRLIQGECE